MDLSSALLGPASALLGAFIGGGTSLIATVYTQRSQDRLQRVAIEVTKRETVYADFVMSASNLLLNAYIHDELVLTGDEQHLIGLINRMRLFASADVVDTAELGAEGHRQDRTKARSGASATGDRGSVQEPRA